jgi:hypothetical protein
VQTFERGPIKWKRKQSCLQVLPSCRSPLVFFGLGTGYFIWGGQALFGFPKTSPEVNRTLGLWGFWMQGFMQFLTGIYLLTGLTWFHVFGNAAPLYMAGLAFTAYGIHWFGMAHRRYIDSNAQLDGWMAIAFLFLSLLGSGGSRLVTSSRAAVVGVAQQVQLIATWKELSGGPINSRPSTHAAYLSFGALEFIVTQSRRLNLLKWSSSIRN